MSQDEDWEPDEPFYFTEFVLGILVGVAATLLVVAIYVSETGLLPY
jgi:hypothetical protein